MDARQEPPSVTFQAGQHETALPAQVNDLHPLAERTLRGFAKAKPDADGRLSPTISRTLAVEVSAENVERAIRTMDKLLKSLRSAGLKFEVPQGRHGLTVHVEGEDLSVRLYEGIGRVNHVPTEEESIRIKKYPDIHGVPEWDERPSGRLNLAIGKEEFRGVRMRWVDGRGHPIESKVESFIEGLVEAAKAKKAWREDLEREERKREEERERAREASNRRYQEQQRVEKLKEQMDDWERSRRIREYIAEMRENALHPEKWKIADVQLPEWMEWALGYADRIDPIGPIRRSRIAESSSDRGQGAPSDSPSEPR